MCDEEREVEMTKKFIYFNPFPSFDYVSTLILNMDMNLWAEYSEKHHNCLKNVYENINDEKIVKTNAEEIGNFTALEAVFYIMLRVIREIITEDPINDYNGEAFYIIREKFKLHVEGVHGWLN